MNYFINDEYLRKVSLGQAELSSERLIESIVEDSYMLENRINEMNLNQKVRAHYNDYMLKIFDAFDGSKEAIACSIESLAEIFSYCEDDETEPIRHLIKCLLEKINLLDSFCVFSPGSNKFLRFV